MSQQRIGISFWLALAVIVSFFVFVPALAHCQVDIVPSRPDQTNIVIGRNLQAGVSGNGSNDCSVSTSQCGVNNNFVFPSLYTQESISVAIFNGSAANITFNVKVAATNDPAVTQFQNNQTRWSPSVAMSSATQNINPNNGTVIINAGTWGNFYAQFSGATRIALILFSNQAGFGGVDVTLSQVQTLASASVPTAIVTGRNIISGSNYSSASPASNTGTSIYWVSAQTATGQIGPIGSYMYIFDPLGSLGCPVSGIGTLGDGVTGSGTSCTPSAGIYFFNGTTFDRGRSQSSASATSSANATGTTLPGMAVTTGPATWTVAVQATTASNCSASLPATATTRHCAVGVVGCVSDTAAQPQLFLNLRDGATGAGTVKWNVLLDGTAGTSSCIPHEFAAGPICGTINTAMTLEFGAATAATNGCTTTIRGYDVQ